jgi:GNAT superfamily N-acetyltransferase
MSIRIERVRPEWVPELGRICFEAFSTLQDRHGVERDFDAVESGEMVVGLFASRADYAGFAALDGDRLLGSNFLGFSDDVASVGPITVSPEAQGRGVGRTLMNAVLDEARKRGRSRVRLQQEAINTSSLSLYESLGFDWREGCALMRPSIASDADPLMRAIEEDDLGTIGAISTRHFHHSRRNEAEGLLRIGVPGVLLERDGRCTGYFFPGMLGHGFAESDADLATLVTQAMRVAPPMFHRCIVPLGENGLHRALLGAGCRTIKLLNYMSVGPYQRPIGAWMPSIGM